MLNADIDEISVVDELSLKLLCLYELGLVLVMHIAFPFLGITMLQTLQEFCDGFESFVSITY